MRLQDAYLGGLMDKVAGKLVATRESGIVGIFLNLNLGAIMKMK